jgi:hypothetical protein
MNIIRLSNDGRFIEGWHNGAIIRFADITHGIHRGVGDVREYMRQWSGEEPAIEAALKVKMDAADMNLINMAFGKEYS